MVAESQSVLGSLPQEVKYTICTGKYNGVQYKSASEVVEVVSGGCSGGGFGGYCDVVVVVLVYWCMYCWWSCCIAQTQDGWLLGAKRSKVAAPQEI